MTAKLKIEKRGDEIIPLEMHFFGGGHLDRRAEPPDTFLEENHPMTISSKFCSC
jgi:hypothetical protein